MTLLFPVVRLLSQNLINTFYTNAITSKVLCITWTKMVVKCLLGVWTYTPNAYVYKLFIVMLRSY